MKTIKIEWIGESKVIPLHGVATPGKVITIQYDLGDSYIKLGLAIEYKKAKSKKSTKEEVK